MLDQDDFKFRTPKEDVEKVLDADAIRKDFYKGLISRSEARKRLYPRLRFRNSLWFAGVLLLTYIAAIVLANYLITHYGQIALPFVAFALIPFDLVIRDLMQDHWLYVPNQNRFYIFKRMVFVILLGAFISWVSGTGSLRVNIASCLAFIIAGSIDALTYSWMIKYGRILRINGATLTAAITDSIIFVTIAFSSVNWKLVGLQIGMKVAGGFVWSLLLFKLFRSNKPNFPKMEDLRTDVRISYADMLPLISRPPIYGQRLNGQPIVVIPRPDCWLCFGGGYKGQICQCHHHPPGRLNSLPCNLRCNPK